MQSGKDPQPTLPIVVATTASCAAAMFIGNAPPLLVPAVHSSDMKRQENAKTSTHGANSISVWSMYPKGTHIHTGTGTHTT